MLKLKRQRLDFSPYRSPAGRRPRPQPGAGDRHLAMRSGSPRHRTPALAATGETTAFDVFKASLQKFLSQSYSWTGLHSSYVEHIVVLSDCRRAKARRSCQTAPLCALERSQPLLRL